MRRFLLYSAAAGLISALCLAGAGAAEPGAKKKPAEVCTDGSCGSFGTSVQFLKSPSEAARQALKEEKLVMVLHVSGLFEDPDFT